MKVFIIEITGERDLKKLSSEKQRYIYALKNSINQLALTHEQLISKNQSKHNNEIYFKAAKLIDKEIDKKLKHLNSVMQKELKAVKPKRKTTKKKVTRKKTKKKAVRKKARSKK